jgi:hypothetical protein
VTAATSSHYLSMTTDQSRTGVKTDGTAESGKDPSLNDGESL